MDTAKSRRPLSSHLLSTLFLSHLESKQLSASRAARLGTQNAYKMITGKA